MLSDMPQKIIKIGQQPATAKVTANVIGAHFLDSQFQVHDVLSVITRQHNLGNVANSIPHLFTETS